MNEVDPNGLNAHEPGAKLDAGKPDVTLLSQFGRALREVARVGDYGQKKYSRGGWLSVSDGVRRYTRAMVDHWFKEESEGVHDLDSHPLMQQPEWNGKIRHDAQVAWNALARLELRLREQENTAREPK